MININKQKAILNNPIIVVFVTLVMLMAIVTFVFVRHTFASTNNGPWSECRHMDGRIGLWRSRVHIVDGHFGLQYEQCVPPTNTPTPTPTVTPTPTPTLEPCGDERLQALSESILPCITPTPTATPEATPTPTDAPHQDSWSPAGVEALPACPNLYPVGPQVIKFQRTSPTDVNIWWTKVDQFVSSYVVYYGPSEKQLVWNTTVNGSEYTELHHLPPNQSIWVSVAETNNGCVGNRGNTIDP